MLDLRDFGMDARAARLPTIGLALLLVGMLTAAVARPVAASSSPITVVTLDSEDGDTIGVGNAFAFAAPSDTIVATGNPGAVSVHVTGNGRDFQIELAAIAGQTLTVGAYESATQVGGMTPRIQVRQDNFGCGSAVGRFDVIEAPTFDGGLQVQSFAADFEQRCDGSPKTLYGSVRVGSTAALKAVRTSSAEWLDLGTGNVMVAGQPTAVTYTNVGTEPVSITGFTKSLPNDGSFLVTIGCNSPLAPGDSCTIGFALKTEAGGLVSSDITIQSDAFRWGRKSRVVGHGTFAPATNGSPSTAIQFTSLPFGHGGSVNGLTDVGGSRLACTGGVESMWYRFTSPTKTRVHLDPTGSESATTLSVMVEQPDIDPIACAQNGLTVDFTAEPGTLYWIRLQRGWQGQYGLVLRASEADLDTGVAAFFEPLSETTFYPYRDRYKDSVAIRGVRNEKASVAVAIYKLNGSRVRVLSGGAAQGAYSIAWNGRTATGKQVASGTYRIKQTVTDLWGNALSVEQLVRVSPKRLYLHTFSKVRDGAAYSASGHSGTGSISRTKSSYSGGVRLGTGTKAAAAAVGYGFTLPRATVFRSVRFDVLGRSNLVSGASADVGVQDWTLCAGWSVYCVDTWGSAPTSYRWSGLRVAGARHVGSGRVVHAYAQAWAYGGLKYLDIRDVRLTVVYGVLK